MSAPNRSPRPTELSSQIRTLEQAALGYVNAELVDATLSITMSGIALNIPAQYEAREAFERNGASPPDTLSTINLTLSYDKGGMASAPEAIQFGAATLNYDRAKTIAISPAVSTEDDQDQHQIGAVLHFDPTEPLLLELRRTSSFDAMTYFQDHTEIPLPRDMRGSEDREVMATLYFNAHRRSTRAEGSRPIDNFGYVTARKAVEIVDPMLHPGVEQDSGRRGTKPPARVVPTMRRYRSEMPRTVNEVAVTMWNYDGWPPTCTQLVLRSDSSSVDPSFFGIYTYTPEGEPLVKDNRPALPSPSELVWISPEDADLPGMTRALRQLMD